MKARGQDLSIWCLLLAAGAACRTGPFDGVPADTAVVRDDGLWLLTPWGPSAPSFPGFPSTPPVTLSFLYIPALRLELAVLGDGRVEPMRPAMTWTPYGRGLRRCASTASPDSCTISVRGSAYRGPAGTLIHLSDPTIINSMKRQRASVLVRRPGSTREGEGADSVTVVYRR